MGLPFPGPLDEEAAKGRIGHRAAEVGPYELCAGAQDPGGRRVGDDDHLVPIGDDDPLCHPGKDRGEPVALGDEIADASLELRRERRESPGEEPELVRRRRVEIDVGVEVVVADGDPPGRVRHREEWARRELGRKEAESDGERERERRREQEPALHRADGRLDFGQRRGRGGRTRPSAAGTADVPHVDARRERPRRIPDAAGRRRDHLLRVRVVLGGLLYDGGRLRAVSGGRLTGRVTKDVSGVGEDRDVGFDDEREPLGELVRVTAPFPHPLRRASGLLEKTLIELAV